jgi:carboxymethylenebutenolidase
MDQHKCRRHGPENTVRVVADVSLPYFFARPAADAPWPRVVVIHEANGISTQLLRFCQRLAGEGYAVLAPDLFFRVGGTEARDYTTLVQSLAVDEERADLAAAAAQLRELGAGKVGITGFCMGGTLSYRAALWDIGYACAAPFYGSGIADELGAPACPVLAFFGGRDEWIPMTAIEKVQAHHGDDVVGYADAGHGFMRDGSPDFHEAAVADAWPRLLGFLAANLR